VGALTALGAPATTPALKARAYTLFVGTSNQIGPVIELVNTGTAAITLSNVTVRYWFTADGTQALQYSCDYTQRGCGNITSRFVKMATVANTADNYLELGFAATAGSLSAGQSTGGIQGRINKSDWSNFDQSNDHSYTGNMTVADCDRIAVYVDGQKVWGNEPATLTDEQYNAFVKANNDFAFALLGQLVAEGEESNLVYSPASISVALGMAYAGARDATANEMAHALHFELSQSLLADAFGKLGQELAERDVAPFVDSFGNDKELLLRLVDSVWLQTDFPIVPAYLDTLQTRYGAAPRLVDFYNSPEPSRIAINDWVADATRDRIVDLLPPGSIDPAIKFVVVNAIYFKGSWLNIFIPEATHSASFYRLDGTTTTVSMMRAPTQTLQYAQGDGWQMVQIPYVGGQLGMTIVLPAAGRFAEILSALSTAWLDQAIASASDTRVNLSLPKFELEPPSRLLTEPLMALGMIRAFDSDADFTGISPIRPLFISDVFHKAYIAVDESGTEAAAATAVAGAGGGPPNPDQPLTLIVDRPFVFFIRDASGALLFAGQVLQP
jgi:serpin B